MHPVATTKYAFRIRTRDGLIVNKLLIPGRVEGDAKRTLRQIYRDCEILECLCNASERHTANAYAWLTRN